MPMHQGRKRDSWQVPHKRRLRYSVIFYLKGGVKACAVVAVPPPVLENLQKYKAEFIQANRDNWFRAVWKQKYLGTKGGKPIYAQVPVMDKTTGRQKIECQLLDVKAFFLGADV